MESMKSYLILFSILVASGVSAQSRCDESILRSILHNPDTKVANSRKDIPLSVVTKLDSIFGFKFFACTDTDSLYFSISTAGNVFLNDNYIVVDYYESGYIFWHWLVVCTLQEGIIQRYDLPVKIKTRKEMINYMTSHRLRCHHPG